MNARAWSVRSRKASARSLPQTAKIPTNPGVEGSPLETPNAASSNSNANVNDVTRTVPQTGQAVTAGSARSDPKPGSGSFHRRTKPKRGPADSDKDPRCRGPFLRISDHSTT